MLIIDKCGCVYWDLKEYKCAYIDPCKNKENSPHFIDGRIVKEIKREALNSICFSYRWEI